MIDPLGPDPNDPATKPTRATDVISDFEAPEAGARLRPKVRHANYDSPEALIRPGETRLPNPALGPASRSEQEPHAKAPELSRQPPQEKPAASPNSEPQARSAAPPTVIPK